MSIKHAFTSAKSDGADATLVQPGDWNADHVVTELSQTFIGARTYRSTDQTGIVTATDTRVVWNGTDVWDPDGFHDPGGANPSRMTVPTGLGGKYLCIATVPWDTNGTGNRHAGFWKNGSAGYVGGFTRTVAGSYPTQIVIDVLDLAAGDYVEVNVYQDSGGNRTLSFSLAGGWFSLTRIASYVPVITARNPVQTAGVNAGNGGTVVLPSFGATPTQGNIIIVCSGIASNADTTPSCTNVSFSRIADITNGTSARASIWLGTVGANPGSTVTMTRSSGVAYHWGAAAEWNGLTAVDLTATRTGAGSAKSTAPVRLAEDAIAFMAVTSLTGGSYNVSSPLFALMGAGNFNHGGWRQGLLNEMLGAIADSDNTSAWACALATVT